MSNMRPRQLLRYDQLEAFLTWAVEQGFSRDPTPPQAIYEVARLRRGKFVVKLWRKDAMKDHCFPSYGASTRLVQVWIQSRKEKR